MRKVALLALVASTLAGCASSHAEPTATIADPVATPSPTTAQQEVIVSMLRADDAKPTMSKEQRAALLDVLATGEVSFEQYQAAITKTLMCAEDAGLHVDGPSTVEQGGQPTLTWGWSDPAQPEGDPKLGEYCRVVHSLAIEQAYLNSDLAREDERRQLEQWRSGIVACYGDNGSPLDDPQMDIFAMLDDEQSLAGSNAEAVESCIDALNIVVAP